MEGSERSFVKKYHWLKNREPVIMISGEEIRGITGIDFGKDKR